MKSNKSEYEYESYGYLRNHVKQLMKTCTTYFLIDHMDIIDYMKEGKTVSEYNIDPSSNERIMLQHDVEIYAVLIVEKEVIVKNEKDALIHYLCVRKGYEGLGYATTLLHYALQDKDLSRKNIHMVTNMPNCFIKKAYQSDLPEVLAKLRNRDKNGNFYELNNLIDKEKKSICSDLVYPGATLAVGRGRSFKKLLLKPGSKSSSVYSIDNLTKYSITSTNGDAIFAKKS